MSLHLVILLHKYLQKMYVIIYTLTIYRKTPFLVLNIYPGKLKIYFCHINSFLMYKVTWQQWFIFSVAQFNIWY